MRWGLASVTSHNDRNAVDDFSFAVCQKLQYPASRSDTDTLIALLSGRVAPWWKMAGGFICCPRDAMLEMGLVCLFLFLGNTPLRSGAAVLSFLGRLGLPYFDNLDFYVSYVLWFLMFSVRRLTLGFVPA